MLYLAQVQKSSTVEGTELQLLAQENSDYYWNYWQIVTPQSIALDQGQSIGEGVLVLVDIDDDHNLLKIQEAQDWVLNLMTKHLSLDCSPSEEIIQQEKEDIETLRQQLTIQTQEFQQKDLEVETRKAKLQELLKELKDKLEDIE